MYTVGSLFAGVGGLDLAAHWAGFTTSWFVEREPFCQKVLAKHWPDVPCHSDVFECHDLPHVDVIVGGFPCQPFSVAGNRKGADDERYLLPEMLRIIREVKPYAVLFENVPGFPSLNDGAEFKYLLRTLAEMGFDAEWGHLRASDCGAPHQRERWFLVASLDDTQSRSGRHDSADKGTSIREKYAPISTGLCGREGQTMVYAQQQRNGVGTEGETWRSQDNSKWNSSSSQRRRLAKQSGVASAGERVGVPHALNVQGKRSIRQSIMAARYRQEQSESAGNRAGQQRAARAQLGRDADGLPGGLDFVGWPARPGEDQHAYEPSRVTSAKTPDRAARLKALGNAVVPQVAYPLFVAIHEWLTARDAEQVA